MNCLITASCLAVLLPPSLSQTRVERLAPLSPKPDATLVTDEHHGQVALVKFADGAGVLLEGGRFTSALASTAQVNAALDRLQAHPERLWDQSDARMRELWHAAEERSGLALHDPTLFYRLHAPGPAHLADLCDALNAQEIVRIAWPAGLASDPSAPVHLLRAASAGDYEDQQAYRGPAPDGVDADFGNSYSGGLGTGVTIIDVETGWTDDHEDIAHKAQGNFIGLCCAPYPWDHGTAVIGELVGQHQAFGVRGLVYDADVLLSTHQGLVANIPTAIANAVAAAGVGDAVVLEVQCFDTSPSPHPCEWDDAIFTTVQLATASGVHVFAAAGNGDNDLDDASYGGKFDRTVRDSGAVLVGASDGVQLNKASFSNYGSRLDSHGWGWDVTTTGYGDLFNGGTLATYTGTFSGTSSATPIVAGAGIQLIGIHREVTGQEISPLGLRALLTSTGTPQVGSDQIGPRPDVRAAVERMRFPTVTISGNLVPGGTLTATSEGAPGDGCVMVFGTEINDTAPAHVAPYGYFMLAGTVQRKLWGALDSSGHMVHSEAIPNDSALSGTTIGYYLTWQRFLSGQPGTGAFGNVAPVEIQ